MRFPTDYLECVRTNNGGRPKPFVVDIPGRKEAVCEKLLRLDKAGMNTICDAAGAIRGQSTYALVPFAEDPFGNYFCFDYSESTSPRVSFWDHEKEQLIVVSDSFSSFLTMLYEPKD